MCVCVCVCVFVCVCVCVCVCVRACKLYSIVTIYFCSSMMFIIITVYRYTYQIDLLNNTST